MLNDAGDWVTYVLWAVFAVCAVTTVILFSGRGTKLIAGYNTASEQEKQKYDPKKLSVVTGSGMAVVSVFLLVMALCAAKLPAFVFYILQGVIMLDCIVMVILANTICKKK